MPKYNSMISKAIDLVAQKLTGVDSETLAYLTQVLNVEAQKIFEELQNGGENIDSNILVSKLDGIATRMKYEYLNQRDHDPSPHEFPIFNVSHNPTAPYPNPINHLYDKRYNAAYSTFIKQNQATTSTPQKNEPPPSPSKPTVNPNSSSYYTYPQGQSQQKSNQQESRPIGFLPAFLEQTPTNRQNTNPYATLPRSQAAYYQQQASKYSQPTQEQLSRRPSTSEDLHSRSLSRSASSNDLNYSTPNNQEKIRVRVIKDNYGSSTTNPQINTLPHNQSPPYRSILKPNNNNDNNKEMVTTRTIYTLPHTPMGTETLQDLFKVVDTQRSEPTGPTPSPMTERVIIIDRRGSKTPDNNNNSSGTDRVRTFEIRTSTKEGTPSTPAPAPVPTPTPIATPSPQSPTMIRPSASYLWQQPAYYQGQQFYVPQQKMYATAPAIMHSATTPFVPGVPHIYPPFGFYHY